MEHDLAVYNSAGFTFMVEVLLGLLYYVSTLINMFSACAGLIPLNTVELTAGCMA